MGGSLCVIKHGWQIPQFPHEQWTQWRLSSSQRVTPKWTQRLSIGSIKNIGSTEVRRNGGMGFQRRISTGVSRVMTSFAHTSLPGWWYTYPSEKYARHLGWWHFQLNGRVKIPWFQSPPTSDVFQNDFLVAAFQAFWQRIPYSHGDSCVVIWAIQQWCYLSLHGWQVEELKFQWFHRFHWASGYIQIIQNSEKPWKREHLVWFCCEKLCKSECIPCQNCALKQVKSLRCGLISSTMDSDSTEIFRNRYIMISDIYWLLEVAALDHPLAEKISHSASVSLVFQKSQAIAFSETVLHFHRDAWFGWLNMINTDQCLTMVSMFDFPWMLWSTATPSRPGRRFKIVVPIYHPKTSVMFTLW